MSFLGDYLPVYIALGTGTGFLLGGLSSFLGYVISKIQGFFDSH